MGWESRQRPAQREKNQSSWDSQIIKKQGALHWKLWHEVNYEGQNDSGQEEHRAHKDSTQVPSFVTSDSLRAPSAGILLPMQASPSGVRWYPGPQMHIYVPMRFLHSICFSAQSCFISSHSSRSGKNVQPQIYKRRCINFLPFTHKTVLSNLLYCWTLWPPKNEMRSSNHLWTRRNCFLTNWSPFQKQEAWFLILFD